METKKCRDCEQEYPRASEFFHYQNKKKNHFCSYCKECKAKRSVATHRNYYLKNREKVLEKTTRYRQDNPEKVREIHADYYQRNRDRVLEHQAKRRKCPDVRRKQCDYVLKRRSENPSYKVAQNVSRLVRMGIEKGNGIKHYSTWKALPYSPEELKEHIEKQFEPWMNWDNYGNKYGQWNIDHIYPQSKLPYDSLEHPNFQKCWALENLRPLCAIKNTQKKDKVFTEDEYSVILNG